MSDGKLYTISHNYKLSAISLKERDNSTEFTDSFAKINSEYYEVHDTVVPHKIPIVANNPYNIKKVYRKDKLDDHYYYYYVNVDGELVVYNTSYIMIFDRRCEYNQQQILDNDVSSILHCDPCGKYIIYVKNNTIIFSNINYFAKLGNNYVIDQISQPIIKSSGKFILDSHNNLYVLVMDNEKFDLKKIYDGVIDFYCDANHAYITDASNMIYSINNYDLSSKYIDIGHFGKPLI